MSGQCPLSTVGPSGREGQPQGSVGGKGPHVCAWLARLPPQNSHKGLLDCVFPGGGAVCWVIRREGSFGGGRRWGRHACLHVCTPSHTQAHPHPSV